MITHCIKKKMNKILKEKNKSDYWMCINFYRLRVHKKRNNVLMLKAQHNWCAQRENILHNV